MERIHNVRDGRNGVEVTPEMIEAGAKAAARVLDESSSSVCELVAREVFRAMIAAQEMTKAQRRCMSS